MIAKKNALPREAKEVIHPCDKTDCTRFGGWTIVGPAAIVLADNGGAPDCYGCKHFKPIDLYQKRIG